MKLIVEGVHNSHEFADYEYSIECIKCHLMVYKAVLIKTGPYNTNNIYYGFKYDLHTMENLTCDDYANRKLTL